MVTTALPWIILFAPFAASLLIVFFSLGNSRAASNLAILGVLTAFAFSLVLFVFHLQSPHHFLPAETHYGWIEAGSLKIGFGFLIDRLSLLMLLVVTGVSSCIFVYSMEYM